MTNLDKSNGSYNAINDLSTKIYVPGITKDVNVKVFNMITRRNEAKMLVKRISCDCKCKFNSSTSNSNQKWNNDKCQCESKKYRVCKEDYNWNPSMCTCQNSRYLKSIADTSVIVCDEIITSTDIVSTNVTSIISTNCTSTMLTNSDDKKVRYKIDFYILHTVFLLFAIIMQKHTSKLENMLT